MNTRLLRRRALLLAITSIVTAGCESARTTAPVAPTVASRLAPSVSGVGTSPPSVNSVSLIDPSFEGGYTGGWTFPGTPGQFVDIGPFWTASDGINSVDLNGNQPGSVSQSFSTIPGVQYTVQFDLAGNPGSPQGVKTLEVSAAGTQANYSFDTNGKSGTNMGWTPQTFGFTATNTSTTLMFRSTYVGNGTYPDIAQGAALDNVRVTWVPTPTTTTVTFNSESFAYTGSAFTATASVSPAGTATIAYTGDCINAGGTCTATATYPGDATHSSSSATASITITKAPTTTTVSFGAGPFVYAGTAFTATASVSPSGSATIAYSGDCINAGTTCTATATYAGDANHSGSSAAASITINKAPSTTTVSFGAGPFVYTGTAFTATASVSPSGSATIAYTGDCINGGTTCTATGTYGGDQNHNGSQGVAHITITYSVCAARADNDERDDQGGDREKGQESGSTVHVRIGVCDAAGRNIGSRLLSVKAVGVSPTGSLSSSGRSNPGNLFRLDDRTYRYNLRTKGFAAGSYTLDYTIGGDPTVYHFAFTIRRDGHEGRDD